MLMLKHHRFDAIAGVIGSLKYSGKTQGVFSDTYGRPFITKTLPMVVACRPEFLDQALAEKLRNTVIKLRKNGTIQRIFDSYHKEY